MNVDDTKLEHAAGVPANDDPVDAPVAVSPEEAAAHLERDLAITKDQLLRALAETENVRRRAERERDEAGKYAINRFAESLLAVADSLRQALASVPAADPDPNLAALRQGVELTERSLAAAFEKHGIKRIDPQGQPFDPHFHQAVMEIEAPDKTSGTVAQVLRDGYTLNDRLLRPAMVAVAKGGPAPAPRAAVDTSA